MDLAMMIFLALMLLVFFFKNLIPKKRITKKIKTTENKIKNNGDYQIKKICNRLEKIAFETSLKIVSARRKNERVLAQVSMGEILTHKDRSKFYAINAKRVDLLITNADFMPLVVIEIDGSGHKISPQYKERDAVKSNALKNAGIALIRIDCPDDSLPYIKKQINNDLKKFFRKYDKY